MASAGNLTFAITAYDNASEVIKRVQQQLGLAQKEIERLGGKVPRTFEKMDKGTRKYASAISAAREKVKSFGISTNDTTKKGEKFNSALSAGGEEAKKASNSITDTKRRVDEAGNSFEQMGNIIGHVSSTLAGLTAGLAIIKKFGVESMEASGKAQITSSRIRWMSESFNYGGETAAENTEKMKEFKKTLDGMSTVKATAFFDLGQKDFNIDWLQSNYQKLYDMSNMAGISITQLGSILGGSQDELMQLGINTTSWQEAQAQSLVNRIQAEYRQVHGTYMNAEAALAQARSEVYADQLNEYVSHADEFYNTYEGSLAKFRAQFAVFKENVGKIFIAIVGPIMNVVGKIAEFVANNKVLTFIVGIGAMVGAVSLIIVTSLGTISKAFLAVGSNIQRMKELGGAALDLIKNRTKIAKIEAVIGSEANAAAYLKETLAIRINTKETIHNTVEEGKNTLATNINTSAEQINATALQVRIVALKMAIRNIFTKTTATTANTAATAANTAETIANTAAVKANNIAQALGGKNLFSTLGSGAGKIVGKIGGLVLRIGSVISGLIPVIMGAAGTAVGAIGAVLAAAAPIIAIVAAIIAIIVAVKVAFDKNLGGFADMIKEIGEMFKGIADAFIAPFKGMFDAGEKSIDIFGAISNLLKPIFDGIRSFIAFVAPILQKVAEFVGTVIMVPLKIIWEVISAIFEVIGEIFADLFPMEEGADGIASAAAAGKGIADQIAPIIQAIKEWLQDILPFIKIAAKIVATVLLGPIKLISVIVKWIRGGTEAIGESFNRIGNVVNTFVMPPIRFIQAIITLIQKIIEKFVNKIKDIGTAIKDFIMAPIVFIQNIIENIKNFFEGIGSAISGFFGFSAPTTTSASNIQSNVQSATAMKGSTQGIYNSTTNSSSNANFGNNTIIMNVPSSGGNLTRDDLAYALNSYQNKQASDYRRSVASYSVK